MKAGQNTTKEDFLRAYDAHSDALFRHCYFRVSSREVALDLTQDAFMKTWEYIHQGNQVDNMKAFLFKVLGNTIIDYYRKHKTESLDSKLDDGAQFASDFSIDNPAKKAEVENLLKSIEKLEDPYKEVIFMRYVDDFSIQEISNTLGENENVISVRIHRGIEKLKEILHI